MAIKRLIIAFGYTPIEAAKRYNPMEDIVICGPETQTFEDVPVALLFATKKKREYFQNQATLIFNFDGVPREVAVKMRRMIIEEFEKELNETAMAAAA